MQSRFRFALPALAGIVIAGCASAQSVPTVSAKLASPQSPGVYDCTEIDVTMTGAKPYANPFDPAEIAVDAAIIAPDGKTATVPGFWYEPFKRAGKFMEKTGEAPRFRVRFAPSKPGIWRVMVTAKDRTGWVKSLPLSVTVAAPSAKNTGFVQSVPGSRYLAFSDGSPAFLVGENVCWAGSRGFADFDDWFPTLGKAGANFARLWMAWQPLESKAAGLGRYDAGQAAYWDEVIRLAQKNNLRCMLAFGTYGEFTTGGFFNEGKWGENPYNAANGGPVPTDKPDEFFTNVAARKAYRNRLRYLVARYGAFTSLGMWEFWNEKSVPPAWYAEMSAAIAAMDAYRHPITNSYGTVGDKPTLSLPRMDITQTHRYGDEGSIDDITPIIIADARAHMAYNKPHLMGEFGISWRGSDEKFDPQGVGTNLHNGLWSSALSGNAGSAMIWWWDSYVHPKNLYGHFAPLAKFTRGIAWHKKQFKSLDMPSPILTRRTPETFADYSFVPTGTWGEKSTSVITVARDGGLGDGVLLSNLFGTEKPDLHGAQRLLVDVTRPTRLRVRVATVSNKSNLRITINGNEAASVPFDASPEGAKGYESTKQFPEYGGIYQALFNKDVTIDLPVGKVAVTLENTTGDWLQIASYTLESFRSSRFAALRTLALQDAPTGETLLWIQDPRSNWKNDRDGKKPESWSGLRLAVPLTRPVKVRAEWWDTRTGRILSRKEYPATNTVVLEPPTFTRDIACRIQPL